VKPDAVLIVIDMQARLLPHIDDGERVLRQCGALVRVAGMLGVPVMVTEQNPEGLGKTAPELTASAPPVFRKDTFDATRQHDFVAALPPANTPLVVAGAEAHVCVLHTVIGLRRLGYAVELASDALGSRRPADKAAALLRAQQEGALMSTSETIIFGWLGSFRHPAFRQALALVK
jgi:nicotinamidase-related amidase